MVSANFQPVPVASQTEAGDQAMLGLGDLTGERTRLTQQATEPKRLDASARAIAERFKQKFFDVKRPVVFDIGVGWYELDGPVTTNELHLLMPDNGLVIGVDSQFPSYVLKIAKEGETVLYDADKKVISMQKEGSFLTRNMMTHDSDGKKRVDTYQELLEDMLQPEYEGAYIVKDEHIWMDMLGNVLDVNPLLRLSRVDRNMKLVNGDLFNLRGNDQLKEIPKAHVVRVSNVIFPHYEITDIEPALRELIPFVNADGYVLIGRTHPNLSRNGLEEYYVYRKVGSGFSFQGYLFGWDSSLNDFGAGSILQTGMISPVSGFKNNFRAMIDRYRTSDRYQQLMQLPNGFDQETAQVMNYLVEELNANDSASPYEAWDGMMMVHAERLRESKQNFAKRWKDELDRVVQSGLPVHVADVTVQTRSVSPALLADAAMIVSPSSTDEKAWDINRNIQSVDQAMSSSAKVIHRNPRAIRDYDLPEEIFGVQGVNLIQVFNDAWNQFVEEHRNLMLSEVAVLEMIGSAVYSLDWAVMDDIDVMLIFSQTTDKLIEILKNDFYKQLTKSFQQVGISTEFFYEDQNFGIRLSADPNHSKKSWKISMHWSEDAASHTLDRLTDPQRPRSINIYDKYMFDRNYFVLSSEGVKDWLFEDGVFDVSLLDLFNITRQRIHSQMQSGLDRLFGDARYNTHFFAGDVGYSLKALKRFASVAYLMGQAERSQRLMNAYARFSQGGLSLRDDIPGIDMKELMDISAGRYRGGWNPLTEYIARRQLQQRTVPEFMEDMAVLLELKDKDIYQRIADVYELNLSGDRLMELVEQKGEGLTLGWIKENFPGGNDNGRPSEAVGGIDLNPNRLDIAKRDAAMNSRMSAEELRAEIRQVITETVLEEDNYSHRNPAEDGTTRIFSLKDFQEKYPNVKVYQVRHPTVWDAELKPSDPIVEFYNWLNHLSIINSVPIDALPIDVSLKEYQSNPEIRPQEDIYKTAKLKPHERVSQIIEQLARRLTRGEFLLSPEEKIRTERYLNQILADFGNMASWQAPQRAPFYGRQETLFIEDSGVDLGAGSVARNGVRAARLVGVGRKDGKVREINPYPIAKKSVYEVLKEMDNVFQDPNFERPLVRSSRQDHIETVYFYSNLNFIDENNVKHVLVSHNNDEKALRGIRFEEVEQGVADILNYVWRNSLSQEGHGIHLSSDGYGFFIPEDEAVKVTPLKVVYFDYDRVRTSPWRAQSREQQFKENVYSLLSFFETMGVKGIYSFEQVDLIEKEIERQSNEIARAIRDGETAPGSDMYLGQDVGELMKEIQQTGEVLSPEFVRAWTAKRLAEATSADSAMGSPDAAMVTNDILRNQIRELIHEWMTKRQEYLPGKSGNEGNSKIMEESDFLDANPGVEIYEVRHPMVWDPELKPSDVIVEAYNWIARLSNEQRVPIGDLQFDVPLKEYKTAPAKRPRPVNIYEKSKKVAQQTVIQLLERLDRGEFSLSPEEIIRNERYLNQILADLGNLEYGQGPLRAPFYGRKRKLYLKDVGVTLGKGTVAVNGVQSAELLAIGASEGKVRVIKPYLMAIKNVFQNLIDMEDVFRFWDSRPMVRSMRGNGNETTYFFKNHNFTSSDGVKYVLVSNNNPKSSTPLHFDEDTIKTGVSDILNFIWRNSVNKNGESISLPNDGFGIFVPEDSDGVMEAIFKIVYFDYDGMKQGYMNKNSMSEIVSSNINSLVDSIERIADKNFFGWRERMQIQNEIREQAESILTAISRGENPPGSDMYLGQDVGEMMKDIQNARAELTPEFVRNWTLARMMKIDSDAAVLIDLDGAGVQKPDAAMVTAEPQKNEVGGIDLNPNRLDIEKRGAGMNWNVPVDPQMLTPSAVEGFVPVIIQIAPANLPMLLGMVEGSDPPGEWAETATIGRL